MSGIWSRLALSFSLLAVFALAGTSSAASAPYPDLPDVRLAGHRGTTVGADENTLSAFKYALPYADILETDVRLTSDGKMVIMHDATLGRTTNCTGRVSERTLSYIKNCKTPRGHHPPSLRQFLTWVDAQPKEVELYLELKGSWSQTRVSGFVHEATSYGSIEEITASSFSESNLAKVAIANDALPDETAGRNLSRAFIEGGDPTMPSFQVCDRYDGYHNNLAFLKSAYVTSLQSVCNPPTTVAVYGSLDSDAEYQEARATGAWVMTVEDVKDARQWLNAH